MRGLIVNRYSTSCHGLLVDCYRIAGRLVLVLMSMLLVIPSGMV